MRARCFLLGFNFNDFSPRFSFLFKNVYHKNTRQTLDVARVLVSPMCATIFTLHTEQKKSHPHTATRRDDDEEGKKFIRNFDNLSRVSTTLYPPLYDEM